MKVGIYTNIFKDIDLKITKLLINELSSRGVNIAVYENLPARLGVKESFNERSTVALDLLITVGGDGTILRIATWCAVRKIPVLGLNLGKVGFLTEVEPRDIVALADAITQKKYFIEQRSLLKTTLEKKTFYALNEFVITRKDFAKMILLDVFIHKQKVDSFYCDGFIVSTPTGSTAYSLSAGGPVISPKAKALTLTPINSHSLHSRPIVISDDETVEIVISARSPEASVTGDGIFCGLMKSEERLNICKAEIEAQFVRLAENNFYGRLLEKLNTWSFTPGEEK